jgi:hypothetical protein
MILRINRASIPCGNHPWFHHIQAPLLLLQQNPTCAVIEVQVAKWKFRPERQIVGAGMEWLASIVRSTMANDCSQRKKTDLPTGQTPLGCAAEAVGALRHWNPRSSDLRPKFAIE